MKGSVDKCNFVCYIASTKYIDRVIFNLDWQNNTMHPSIMTFGNCAFGMAFGHFCTFLLVDINIRLHM